MATGNITKRAVDAIAPAPRNTFMWDQEVKGFGLKVTPSGGRTYVYQYRTGGRGTKVQRCTIGAHGAWTPDQARKEAKRLAVLVDQGIDPAADAKRQRQEKIDLAFPVYAERFIELYIRQEWKGGQELAAGLIRKHLIPAFEGKTIKQLHRGDVAALMDRMSASPASRRNAFAVLRRLFRWAVSRGDLDVSPLREMDPPPAPASRDRVLSDHELALIWKASAATGYPFGPFIRVLLLTGQRREEVSALSWNELSRDKALWKLPAQRAKNAVAHDVPLSAPVISLLDEIANSQKWKSSDATWPRKGFVFTMTGDKAVTGYSTAKKRLDKMIEKIALQEQPEATSDGRIIEPWRFHDLRRTLATGFQRLGIRFEVTEAVLNHLSGSRSGIAGVYQRHHWSDEKRAALDAWATHVASLVDRTV